MLLLANGSGRTAAREPNCCRNDVTVPRRLPARSCGGQSRPQRIGEPARAAPKSAAGSRQCSSISNFAIPARDAAGSRTQSFAVVTSARRRARASRRSPASPPALSGGDRETGAPRRSRRRHAADWRKTWRAGRCRRRRRRARRGISAASTGAQPARKTGRAPPARLRAGRRRRSGRSRRRAPGPPATGSRNGPAGITRPLPKPYSASTTTQRQILGDPRVLKPVIEHDDLRRRPPPRRGIRRPGRARPSTAPPRASSSASSPTAAASCAGRIDPQRAGEPPAIAARHDVHRDAACGDAIRRATARPASCRSRRRPDCRRRSPAPARGTAAPRRGAAARRRPRPRRAAPAARRRGPAARPRTQARASSAPRAGAGAGAGARSGGEPAVARSGRARRATARAGRAPRRARRSPRRRPAPPPARALALAGIGEQPRHRVREARRRR